jgi:hypothetical protein
MTGFGASRAAFLLANLAHGLSPVHFHGNIFFFLSSLLPEEGIKINILLTLSQEGCNTENCSTSEGE